MKRTTGFKSDLTAAGVVALMMGIAACEKSPSTSSASPVRREAPAADNTSRNAADRNGGTTTPPDQSESETDRRITADIRKAILAQKLSVNAGNCKIITKNGVVTLRGPVSSQAEKDFIGAAAQSVTGVKSVTNELEVKV